MDGQVGSGIVARERSSWRSPPPSTAPPLVGSPSSARPASKSCLAADAMLAVEATGAVLDGDRHPRIAGPDAGRASPTCCRRPGSWPTCTTTCAPPSCCEPLRKRSADEAGDRPLVLAIDDAHLLDPVSAHLVGQLVANGIARVVLTVRTGEPAPTA